MLPIEFFPQSAESALRLIPSFEGFSKIQGMLWCRALKLPTLRGLVIDPLRVERSAAISAAASLNDARYLVRHDKSPETGMYPQGGYVVTAKELPEELAWYAELQRLLILFEPADPFDNLYSASALLTTDDLLQIEIVGPGFDASDINRGMVSPLESYQFQIGPQGLAREVAHAVADSAAYSLAKSLRIRKVALKFIERRRFFRVDDLAEGAARQMVELDTRSSKPQLRHLLSDEDYRPAPRSFVNRLVQFAYAIHRSVDIMHEGERTSAFSASIVENGARTVVWDIIRPKRKYARS